MRTGMFEWNGNPGRVEGLEIPPVASDAEALKDRWAVEEVVFAEHPEIRTDHALPSSQATPTSPSRESLKADEHCIPRPRPWQFNPCRSD